MHWDRRQGPGEIEPKSRAQGTRGRRDWSGGRTGTGRAAGSLRFFFPTAGGTAHPPGIKTRSMRGSLLATHFLLAIVIGIARPAVSAAAEQEDKPTALTIFDAALAQFENSRVALRKWQYRQTLTTHQLDADGKVVAKGTWHSIVRPGDPRPLEYTGESIEGKL